LAEALAESQCTLQTKAARVEWHLLKPQVPVRI
jgi:hypothetical protein